MQILLGQLQATEALLSKLVGITLPVSLAYKVNKLAKLVQPEIEFYYQQLNAIISEYAERDSDGKFVTTGPQSIKIQEDKLSECEQKLDELGKISVATDVRLLTIDDLDKLSTAGFTLTPLEIEAFSIFIA